MVHVSVFSIIRRMQNNWPGSSLNRVPHRPPRTLSIPRIGPPDHHPGHPSSHHDAAQDQHLTPASQAKTTPPITSPPSHPLPPSRRPPQVGRRRIGYRVACSCFSDPVGWLAQREIDLSASKWNPPSQHSTTNPGLGPLLLTGAIHFTPLTHAPPLLLVTNPHGLRPQPPHDAQPQQPVAPAPARASPYFGGAAVGGCGHRWEGRASGDPCREAGEALPLIVPRPWPRRRQLHEPAGPPSSAPLPMRPSMAGPGAVLTPSRRSTRVSLCYRGCLRRGGRSRRTRVWSQLSLRIQLPSNFDMCKVEDSRCCQDGLSKLWDRVIHAVMYA
ncbi:uncharacterized protein LOC133910806 [Phragmites australis]|uniref:uncharacterized protein LOC133910806 n=1 Tax=Phragmites australis TaxID=29695 RepID=UPI002D7756AC|nr:uncharacterized protein LOC133910806 [Phragmites australis]